MHRPIGRHCRLRRAGHLRKAKRDEQLLQRAQTGAQEIAERKRHAEPYEALSERQSPRRRAKPPKIAA